MSASQRIVDRIPGFAWPQGVRCAVNVTLDFDAQLARRINNEPRLELTEGEFGGRTGIWRLMDVCTKHAKRWRAPARSRVSGVASRWSCTPG